MVSVMDQKIPYVTKLLSGTVRCSAVPMYMPRPVTREWSCRPAFVSNAQPEIS